jgi:hypothetical protein
MADYAIEVIPASSVGSSRYLRMLILGAAGIGKTSCVLMTAPKPIYVINSDRKTSLNPGTELCLENKISTNWVSSMVHAADKMEAAIKTARQLVKEKGYKTIVWDTMSSYSKFLLEQCTQASLTAAGKPDGRKFWPEYHKRLEAVVDRLHMIDAHVIVCSHWEDNSSSEDDADEKKTPKVGEGIVPMLGGASRKRAGQWFEDVVFMQKNKGGERVLKTDIEGVWGPSTKSLPGTMEVPADITAFIKAKDERLKKLIRNVGGR